MSSLVIQPLNIKDEHKDLEPTPIKLSKPIESLLSTQPKSYASQLQTSSITSTSNSALFNASQQGSFGSITSQQAQISGPTGTPFGAKTNLISQVNSTTPAPKTMKSFNPTESFLSNFSTPPLNTNSTNGNATVEQNRSRLPSNSIGSGSLLTSIIGSNKTSLNINSQSMINPSNITSTQSIIQQNTIAESADVSNFTNQIFQQPYLFYQSSNMNIPQLEASQDDLYTVFTFIVPNKPYPTYSTNSQLQKNNHSNSSNNNNPCQSLNGNFSNNLNTNTITPLSIVNSNQKSNINYTSYNSSNTLSSQQSNSNTPVTQHSSHINQCQSQNSNNPSNNGVSPNAFKIKEEEQLTQPHKNIQNEDSTNPKVTLFGLTGQTKEERKSNQKNQSLVEIIKQQCQPEDERRKKSDSISTLNNLNSGFKSGFNSSSNLGSVTQLPMTGLSQSSITSLLNLSLNNMNNNGNNNTSGFKATNSTNNFSLNNYNQNNDQLSDVIESEEVIQLLQSQIKQEQVKQEFKHESQSQLNTMADVDEEKVVMPDSNDNDFDEEGNGDDKKSGENSNNDDEDEEARLIREIKEMKRKKIAPSMFAKSFKKNGGFLFGGEGSEGDIFDFCEEKLTKKQKKNCNSGSHKNKFDTKNLVKNFLNSFISFAHHPDEEAPIIDVLQFESSPQLNDFRSNLRSFFKGKKFNRVLLKEFIFEDIFRPLFLFFLENRALNWIESGRMKDKASHLRALKNFIFVCQHYDQIKSWRFRYNFVSN